MHIHILGICGTFMAGVAAIAKVNGHHVTGCDKNVYPPMSTQLQRMKIELIDLSYKAARKLDFVNQGTVKVRIDVLRLGDNKYYK